MSSKNRKKWKLTNTPPVNNIQKTILQIKPQEEILPQEVNNRFPEIGDEEESYRVDWLGTFEAASDLGLAQDKNSESEQKKDLPKKGEQQSEILKEPDERVDMNLRTAKVERVTKETKISLELNLDGTGEAVIDTGIGFFDHMLYAVAKHGFLDLKLKVQGDLIVDGHHTIEDTGIVLGQALKEALGEKKGIKRYGSCMLPMDETLVLCAVDFCGRPYLNFTAEFTTERLGYMETEMVREFFYAISYNAGMNLHLKVLDGKNNHHIAEALFKSFAKALDEAKTIDPRIEGVLSTKGVISL